MRISVLEKKIIRADNLVQQIIDGVATGKRVVVRGLGSFYPVSWETRTVKLGGKDKIVKGRNIVMFRASKRFKEKVRDEIN